MVLYAWNFDWQSIECTSKTELVKTRNGTGSKPWTKISDIESAEIGL